MQKKIKTAGDLRAFLCDAIQKVEGGEMDVEVARNITKLAAQVNESIYAEAKIAKLKVEQGEKPDSFGLLGIVTE